MVCLDWLAVLFFRARESRRPTFEGETEGDLVFVYDYKTERLYARYDD